MSDIDLVAVALARFREVEELLAAVSALLPRVQEIKNECRSMTGEVERLRMAMDSAVVAARGAMKDADAALISALAEKGAASVGLDLSFLRKP